MNRQEKQQELGISGEEECWILSSRTRLRDPKCHPACQEDFGFCSTIFFGPHLSVPTTGTKGCCGLIFSAASISCSLGTPERGHINARRSWWRPRAEWRHLLCLNKPALGAGGVNMAGPPSLRCLPGNGLARAGPGRDVSSLWHHWRSWSLSLSLCGILWMQKQLLKAANWEADIYSEGMNPDHESELGQKAHQSRSGTLLSETTSRSSQLIWDPNSKDLENLKLKIPV